MYCRRPPWSTPRPSGPRTNAPADTAGYDAAKRTKGRKRHIATDTLGLLLVLIVTAGNVQDSAGGKRLLDALHAQHPTVTKGWADGGYNAQVVERTFGWLVQHRRLVRDYEAQPQRSRAMIHWSMTDTMARRLTRVQHRPLQNQLPNPDREA